MTDLNFTDISAEPSGPDPDYPYCPTTGHTDYLMDVDSGDITLTCTTCGKKIDPDLLDAFATSCEIPVTVELESDPGDGWEFGPEFSGTITPRDGSEQLRAERDELAKKLEVATRTVAELAVQRDRLNTDVERLQVELGLAIDPEEYEEPLTLHDVDPAYFHECEEADRAAEKAYEPGPGYDGEAPF